MTNKTPNERDPARPGGSETPPSDEDETAQPPEDLTRRMAGCGCGPVMERMMGKCFKGGAKKGGERT